MRYLLILLLLAGCSPEKSQEKVTVHIPPVDNNNAYYEYFTKEYPKAKAMGIKSWDFGNGPCL